MQRQFKEPILASIYSAMGYIVIIIGVLISIGWFIGGLALIGHDGGNILIGIFAALGSLLIAALIALPLFGIAQLITYIGKTALYAETIDESLTISTHEISKSLGDISRRMEISAMKDSMKEALQGFKQTPIIAPPEAKGNKHSPITPPPLAPRTIPENCDCPECGKAILISELKIGGNGITKCPHCGCYFKIETD